jgi:vacuolar-type H+-ATPase subunit H
VSKEIPFHICQDDHSNGFYPLAIGYGITGIYEEPKSFSYLDQKTRDSITGFGIKKAILLRGLDLNRTDYRQNMKACCCVQRKVEMRNIILEKCMRKQSTIEHMHIRAAELQYEFASNKKNKIDECKRHIRSAIENMFIRAAECKRCMYPIIENIFIKSTELQDESESNQEDKIDECKRRIYSEIKNIFIKATELQDESASNQKDEIDKCKERIRSEIKNMLIGAAVGTAALQDEPASNRKAKMDEYKKSMCSETEDTFIRAVDDITRLLQSEFASLKMSYNLAKAELELAKSKFESTSEFASLKISYNLAKAELELAKSKSESTSENTSKADKEAKNLLEEAKKMIPFFADSQAGSGFSGSLVFRVKKDIENNEDNEDKNYDVFGIFSGPLFTEEIKSFIKNAAHHYNQNQVN